MYAIEYTREALKTLGKMSPDTRVPILRKIVELASDPAGARNVKKLAGVPGFRLRVGDWRVIYDLQDERLVIRVLTIGSRGGVYK